MSEEIDPPRKFYDLKPREFERVNPPTGTPSADVPLDVRDHFIAATGSTRPPPTSAPAPSRNEVHDLLRTNLVHEHAAGLHEIAPLPPRRSRRKLDYVLSLICGNLLIAASGVASGFNVVVTVYTFAGVVLFSVGITWVMWGVMDDY